jgi:hypothetical protein
MILSVLDEEPFVAVEPATRTGLGGRMSGVVDKVRRNLSGVSDWSASRAAG